LVEDGGQATLGPGGRAATETGPGHQQGVDPGLGQPESGGQSGSPRTDDHHTGIAAHSPLPGLPISIIRCTDRRARSAMLGSTVTSSRPSRRLTSNFSGVIIFMNLHDAWGLTARNSVRGLACCSWCNIPTSVATSTVSAVVVRAASSIPPVDVIVVRSLGSSPRESSHRAEVEHP